MDTSALANITAMSAKTTLEDTMYFNDVVAFLVKFNNSAKPAHNKAWQSCVDDTIATGHQVSPTLANKSRHFQNENRHDFCYSQHDQEKELNYVAILKPGSQNREVKIRAD